MTKVLSVGGSIIVPEKPDTEFLTAFVKMCTAWLDQDKSRRFFKLQRIQSSPSRALFQRHLYPIISARHRREAQLRRTFGAITPHTQRQFLRRTSRSVGRIAARTRVIEEVSRTVGHVGRKVKNNRPSSRFSDFDGTYFLFPPPFTRYRIIARFALFFAFTPEFFEILQKTLDGGGGG